MLSKQIISHACKLGIFLMTMVSESLMAKTPPAKLDPEVTAELCRQNDLAACIRLSIFYEKLGQIDKAIPLYKKSCLATDHLSCQKLAKISGRQNKTKVTLRWLRAECRSPSSKGEGCYQIALIASNQKLAKSASTWFRKACTKGHKLACKSLNKPSNKEASE